jgi:hypothetical protein
MAIRRREPNLWNRLGSVIAGRQAQVAAAEQFATILPFIASLLYIWMARALHRGERVCHG